MEKLWKNTEDDFYRLKDVTSGEIKQFEKTIGVNLPEEYKQLLVQQNGGEIQFNAVETPYPTSWHETHFQVEYLYGLEKDKGLMETFFYQKEWGLPEDVYILSGEAPYWIVLDYRENKDPFVSYVDVEVNRDFVIAKTFSDFLDLLYIHEYLDIDFAVEERVFTEREAEEIIHSDNSEEIFEMLQYFQYNYEDFTWWLNQIKKLAKTKDTNTVGTAIEALHQSVNFQDKAQLESALEVSYLYDQKDFAVQHVQELLREALSRL